MTAFIRRTCAVVAVLLLVASAGRSETAATSGSASLQSATSGKMSGVGLRLENGTGGGPVVLEAMAGQPAEQAGIRTGETIVSVDGRPTAGMALEDVIKAITGEPGTKVSLGVRDSQGAVRNVGLTRAVIRLPGVTAKQLEGRVGYLAISAFNQETAFAVRDALTGPLSVAKVRGLIIDLRGNPGGLYPEMLRVALMLIDGRPPKLLWTLRRSDGTEESVRADGPALTTLPCVVIIDSTTIGAGEALAAALKWSGGCKLVGAPTPGKAEISRRETGPDGSSQVVKVGSFLFVASGKTGNDPVVPDVAAPKGAAAESVLALARRTLAPMLKQ